MDAFTREFSHRMEGISHMHSGLLVGVHAAHSTQCNYMKGQGCLCLPPPKKALRSYSTRARTKVRSRDETIQERKALRGRVN
ncbi:Interferon-induced GTP-binding protein MxE [Fusarium oxysporum f. sp. albedinis]|nr:Interferon-induced GTP-binding protein MxE [Fusarium oxysporum f. sp. albedinis]